MKRRTFLARSALACAKGALVFAGAAIQCRAKSEEHRTVWGIPELWQWLYQKQQSSGSDSADCLQAHLDMGIRHVLWSLGRSTLDYQSALPTSTLYAGDTRPETKVIGHSFQNECSLRAALAFANQHKMTLYGRLGMNRHYGDALGGGLRSKFIAMHPEWMERHRGGQVDATKVSFAIPEYREERISILLEAAQIGAHGLCLDFCRQPPIARYHPEILNPWLAKGMKDPRQVPIGSADFREWARHRSEFVNLFMRDLRKRLRALESSMQRPVPILVRIPEATLDINLMEGLDVSSWLKEGLIDEIALNPLWIWDINYSDSAVQYVQLARAHSVKIYGGANTTAGKGVKPNARAFLERISRNYREGVDGIALFQTDAALLVPELTRLLARFIPRLHEPGAITELLTSARISQPELNERERAFGLDNHSLLPDLSGSPRLALETL